MNKVFFLVLCAVECLALFEFSILLFQWGLKKDERPTWVLVKHPELEVSKSVVLNVGGGVGEARGPPSDDYGT